MIDSIFTAMTGLQGHQRGLSTISSNVANMNTPGFRGSHVDFTDLINSEPGTGDQSMPGNDTAGRGLDASRITLDLKQGEVKETGRDLDVALSGEGFFAARDSEGALHYTRNGSFEFNDKGVLVLKGSAMTVVGRSAAGELADITLDGRRTSPPAVTSEVVLSGNLSSTDTDHTIENLNVFDALGGKHTLKLVFANTDATTPGTWSLTVFEGSTQLGTGQYAFAGGTPTVSTVTMPLALNGASNTTVSFVLSSDTTGFSSGTTSTLALKTQNGREAGQITVSTFDDHGVLKITYSNGQTLDGSKLVLAQLPDDRGLIAAGEGVYSYIGSSTPTLREAGSDLRVTPKSLEQSNVDLTSEFSALILMQRGYQASSQVLTTANEMLQQLFETKGRR